MLFKPSLLAGVLWHFSDRGKGLLPVHCPVEAENHDPSWLPLKTEGKGSLLTAQREWNI